MALPSQMYKDPSLYVANKESYEVGCFGCKNRTKSKNLFGRRWKCQFDVFGFPNNNNSCSYYVKHK